MDRGPSALSPEARIRALGTLATGGTDELDVLVVGGGVVGVGIALDAVTRGLNTGLLEQRDLASGTSSRSSKLIHGGLRYLEMLDFGLVREALQERGLLLTRLAPHLVRPVPFLYPLTHRGWERPYVGAGLALYDGMAMLGKSEMGVPRHRHLFRRQVARIAPGLQDRVDHRRDPLLRLPGRRRPAGGDDRPHRRRARRARRDPGQGDRLPARGRAGGRRPRARPGDAAGARGPRPGRRQRRRRLDRRDPGDGRRPRRAARAGQSKGIHLVVPRDRIRSEAGFIVRTETSVLFVIPWGRHWIIGTTDTPWNLDKAHPAASRADIDYVLDHVNAILREPLDHEDVEGVYAGLRPLLSGESEPTSRISREHTVVTPVPGLVMIAGGKLTTYRVMGRDAVDAAAHSLRTTVNLTIRDSITHRVPLRRCRRLGDAHQPAGAARPPLRPARRPDRPPARAVRRPGRRPARAGRRAARAWRCRSRVPRTTSPPRSSTRSPTRAPGTSTTCSPAVPASRSRPSTAACAAAPVAAG